MHKDVRNHYQMIIESDLNEIQHVEEFTEELVNKLGFSEEERDSLAISITEMVGNAISHGNKHNEKKKVVIDFYINKEGIRITIQDEGDGFNVDEVDNPLEPENLLKDSGRGIYIVRTLMDKVSYHYNKKGTLVEIIKNFN